MLSLDKAYGAPLESWFFSCEKWRKSCEANRIFWISSIHDTGGSHAAPPYFPGDTVLLLFGCIGAPGTGFCSTASATSTGNGFRGISIRFITIAATGSGLRTPTSAAPGSHCIDHTCRSTGQERRKAASSQNFFQIICVHFPSFVNNSSRLVLQTPMTLEEFYR